MRRWRLQGRLAKHTLFTTLFSFWITGFGVGILFSVRPADIAFILIVGSALFPVIVSLPIYCFLVHTARNKALVVEKGWDLHRVGAVASLCNIGITAGLAVFVYWKLFGGM